MNCKSNNFDVNLVLNPIELNCLDMKFSKHVDLKYKVSEFFSDFTILKKVQIFEIDLNM